MTLPFISFNKNYATLIRSILSAILLTFIVPNTSAQNSNADMLTALPEIPAQITNPTERCNYVVNHYWDHFSYKTAFSSKQRMSNTLGRFFEFVPCAAADTVYAAIDRLLTGVAKNKPNDLLDLCRMAETWTQGDTAEFASDDLYYPFVKAVAENKKIKGAEKARYDAQYKLLTNSRRGATVSNFSFTRPDGTKASLADITDPHVLLIFADPSCIDCSLVKARLSADYVVEALVKADVLDIVVIYPGEPDDARWLADAKTMPTKWTIGAWPEADTYFDIPDTPTIYYLNGDRRVMAKNMHVDNILAAFHQLVSQPGSQAQSPDEQPDTGSENPVSAPNVTE